MQINIIFQILILLFSVIIHEISHGFMALAWGDKTAQYEGRLTLNPIKHIDLFGSIILPLLLFVLGTNFMIGWAKPVPYNPYNLRNRKIAEPLVALAGPFSNFAIAFIFGLLIKNASVLGLSISLANIFTVIVRINISLCIFNLIPIPPLDGSKILFSILPIKNRFVFSKMAQNYGFIVLILIVALLPDFISPIIFKIFTMLTGIGL